MSRRPRWVRPVLAVNLVAQVGIVVTGGLVRLTGSGLGCPTWPQCVPGSYTPTVEQPQGFHKEIEFGNRLLTFVVTVAAVAALAAAVAAVRRGGAPRGLLLLGAVPFVGVVAQAVLGGVTVLTGLSPATVAAHLLLSMVLVSASTVLLLAVAGRTTSRVRARAPRLLAVALAAATAVVLVLGTVVTGSGPHSGDATTPARLGLDPAAAARVHAEAVWLFVALVVALVVVLRRSGEGGPAPRRAVELLAVTLLQGAVGYVQYVTDLPAALVAVHLLGAGLLVVAATACVTSVLGALGVVVPSQPPPTAPVAIDPTAGLQPGRHGAGADVVR